MDENKRKKQNREDILEMILAETAKNPYIPKENIRREVKEKPLAQGGFDNKTAPKKAVAQKPEEKAQKPDLNQRPVIRDAQKDEYIKERTANKVMEIKAGIRRENSRNTQESGKVAEYTAVYNKSDFKGENPENSQALKKEKSEREEFRRRKEQAEYDYEHFEEQGEEEKKPGALKNAVNNVLDIAEYSVIVIFLVLLVFTYIFRLALVDGESMYPTLESGDRVVVRSIGYKPQTGDVVVIDSDNAYLLSEDGSLYSEDGLGINIIKRVIAMGGQTIDIDFESGTVTVDGNVLSENYINELTTRDEYAFSYPLEIPEGYVFVMGDNRNVSKDSRHPEVGLVSEEDIIGKATLRIYPFEKIGGVD